VSFPISGKESEENKMKKIDVLAAVLMVVGGLNWGLMGFANFDLVASLFGAGSPLAKVVYSLVGLAALYQSLTWKAIQTRWQWRLATATN
jgi:uncharacterized membrane protein YuzA (DUF378 family)